MAQSVKWLDYRLDDRRSGLYFQQEQRFLLLQSVQTGSCSHLRPDRWVPESLSPWINPLGHEADLSTTYSTVIENVYTSILPFIFITWCLVKHNDNFWDFTYIHMYLLCNGHDFSFCLGLKLFKCRFFRDWRSFQIEYKRCRFLAVPDAQIFWLAARTNIISAPTPP
jgi:hypothetical protein